MWEICLIFNMNIDIILKERETQMKKFLVILGLLAVSAPVFAADKYASVDLDKVLRSYKETADATAQFQKEEADIRIFVLDAQKKVVSAKTDAEKKLLEEKNNKELQSKVDALQAKKVEALKKIDAAVKAQIDKIGKTGTYALILPANNTLYGTVDITDQIIKGLNAAK